jgi:long-chain acyl-CoA synthetase
MSLDERALGLARRAERNPDKVALMVGQTQLTYALLNARVNRLARALHRIGIGPGDAVAAILHNDAEWLELLNAVGKIGALLVPIGYRLKGPEIEYMLVDSNASVIVADPQLADDVDRGVAGLDWGEEKLWITGPPGGAWRGSSYEEVLGAERPDEPEHAFTGSGYNVLIYTSGTTGRPRAVERPTDPATAHLALAGVAKMWDFDEHEVHLCPGPLYHTGPGSYAQLHLLIGATLVLMRRFDAAGALDLIERHRVTNTFMVPTHFTRILFLDEEERRRDLSSLRLVMHSAAPCPVHVKHGIMRVFPPGTVTEFYGASESGFTKITAREWLEKPGSVGRPWPGHELVILDEHGAPCAPGEVGLIYVRSARTDFRYRDSDEKNRGAFRNGFFTAGDLGYLDDDGYLFIADRRTDLIITGGANVYPAEVEGVLMEHPQVADVAVLGIPDDEMGKSVLAVVEPREGADLTAESVIAFAQENLAHYKCPRRVEIVAELPREPQGKIKKHQLLERYWPL